MGGGNLGHTTKFLSDTIFIILNKLLIIVCCMLLSIIIILHTKIFHTMSSKNILEIFGENVQKYRKERQISQEKLAEIAGVHRTYVGMIERVEKRLRVEIFA